MKKTNDRTIYGFEGEYHFLSNFYPLKGTGHSVEHIFQAAKAIEPEQAVWILRAPHPSEAKQRGRVVNIRPDWDSYRVDAMRKALEYKFENPDLRARLLATGDKELVEANPWHDYYWGVDKWTGKGLNMLGKLLMKLRDDIKQEEQENND